jgi:hypothetical protein
LFEPAIYAAAQDESMDETASMHTNVGSKAFENGGGVAVTDDKIFFA